jgi:hypothetical protein
VLIATLASTGPFTGILEAVATSIGAGIVVGGFTLGMVGVAAGQPQKASEAMALTGGNVGGVVGLLLLSVDILTKHAV